MADGTDAARTMKRRGILAAAGAVVAGIVAKGTSQPVAATTNQPLLIGVDAQEPTTSGDTTEMHNPGQILGVNLLRIQNYATGLGFVPTAQMRIAIVGHVSDAGAGGIGDASATLIGVLGHSNRGFGLHGSSDIGIGSWGQAGGAGSYGVYGYASGAAGVGLYGFAPAGTGVYGVTNAAGNYGVLGTAGATANATAIAGQATGAGASAFSGGNPNVNGFAAYFDGHVQVNGPFDVIGAGNKHAAVPHPDGSHRTIYSIEAPEAWVEDFGTGTLAGGKADVKLDPDFAALIQPGAYHVFLTEHGGTHHHLSVATTAANGFTVEADGEIAQLKGKKTSDLTGTFSWRIVARPQTTAKVGRLAKVNIADAKALLPDPTKLPKPQAPLAFPPPTPGTKP